MDMLAIELLEVIPMDMACHRTVGSYSNGHACHRAVGSNSNGHACPGTVGSYFPMDMLAIELLEVIWQTCPLE